MSIRKEIRNWFSTHKPQANNILFTKLKKDEISWNEILSETKFLPTDCTPSRRIWHYFYEVNEIPKCEICGNELKFRIFSSGYPKTCSRSCTTKKKWQDGKMDACVEKRTETFKVLYGKDGPLHEELIEKRKATSMKNYGAEHHMKSKEYHDAYKQDLMEKYGVDNHSKRPEIIEKIKETWSKPDKDEVKKRINATRDKTMLEKYGKKSPYDVPEIQERIKETMVEKYGHEKPLQVPEFKSKQMATMKEKYGYENPSQVPELKDKKRQTMESNGSWVPEAEIGEWVKYKRAVISTTRTSLKQFGDAKFGKDWNINRGKMGVNNAIQIDHIYSIKEGYLNKVAPELVGSINNLQILSWEENISKGTTSAISLSELEDL